MVKKQLDGTHFDDSEIASLVMGTAVQASLS